MQAMKPEVVIQTPCPPTADDCACYTQVIVDGNITIPPHKPEKERIINFLVSCEVTNWFVIDTPVGQKVVVSGLVHIGLQYVANLLEQPVHYAHFDIPWHTFILCEATPPPTICDVDCCIEFADYDQLDHRTLSKFVVLFVCAKSC